jgi:hypothetical protein
MARGPNERAECLPMSLHRLLAPVLVSALALAPLPALAKDAPLGRVVEELTDPARQDALAGGLEALTQALLELKVGPFMKAMERAGHGRDTRDIDPDTTLGDLAGPQAREIPREVSGKVPVMMDTMGAMAGQMEVMLPELEAMAKRMEGAMDQSMRRDRRRSD